MQEDLTEIIPKVMRQFYTNGWCSGSGGGISIRANGIAYFAPSGIQKELLKAEDIFLVEEATGNYLKRPNLAISACTPLFTTIYKFTGANAALHTHSRYVVHVSTMFDTEFSCTNLEMMKGIEGNGNTGWVRVPIIENTEHEAELVNRLREAILSNPYSKAVIVRNHGAYVWGKSWEQAKIHAEAYDYLFQVVYESKIIGKELERFTPSPDPYIRSWYMLDHVVDETKGEVIDQREALQPKEPRWLSRHELANLGVLSWNLSGLQEDSELEQIRRDRGYKNFDIVNLSPETMGASIYEEKLKLFFDEHLHEDEEIRYILDGSGYFDVRDKDGEWIRIHVIKGDMLILPEGIYHRFTPNKNNFVMAMRLFRELPFWIPHSRSIPQVDSMISRHRYVAFSEFLRRFSDAKLILWDFDETISSFPSYVNNTTVEEARSTERSIFDDIIDPIFFRTVVLHLRDVGIKYGVVSYGSPAVIIEFMKKIFGNDHIISLGDIYSPLRGAQRYDDKGASIDVPKNKNDLIHQVALKYRVNRRRDIVFFEDKRQLAHAASCHGYRSVYVGKSGFSSHFFNPNAPHPKFNQQSNNTSVEVVQPNP
jgi:methylthioribulose-1-phosphate dehydratase